MAVVVIFYRAVSASQQALNQIQWVKVNQSLKLLTESPIDGSSKKKKKKTVFTEGEKENKWIDWRKGRVEGTLFYGKERGVDNLGKIR